jgi:hypothetical protein
MVQTANPVITHVGNSIASRLKRSTGRVPPRLRWLVRFLPAESPKDSFLSTIRVLARSVGVEARNPKWTSYGALELDIFCPTGADFDTFLTAAKPIANTEFVTDLNRAPEYQTDDEILAKARRLFNSERYWECHEVLEGLWRQKQGAEKRLLQGIILVCAAFVHHQKGEDGVAVSVLNRGAKALGFPLPQYGPFDLPRMRNEVQLLLKAHRLTGFTV